MFENIFIGVILSIMILVFAVPLVLATFFFVKSAYRYKYVAPKQKKMFNQLKKGDYVWRVNESGVTYFTVDKVDYDFDYNKQIKKIKIHYGDAFSDFIELTPDVAKTFNFYNWYTIKAAAEIEYRYQEQKRNEAILGVTSSTPEDIKKASEKIIKQLETTK